MWVIALPVDTHSNGGLATFARHSLCAVRTDLGDVLVRGIASGVWGAVQLRGSKRVAGCVGIAGSTRIGSYCMIAGASGIGGHLEICDHVVITAMSTVLDSISEPGQYGSGIPARPLRAWQRILVRLGQLDRLFRPGVGKN